MSGLKIVKSVKGVPTDDISIEGYKAVTEGIILNSGGFTGFVNGGGGSGNPGARADYLQNVVQTAVPDAVVTTKRNDEPISHDNCHIVAVPDVDLGPGRKARHTVPMPPTYLTSLTYLDEYIEAFLDLWNSGDHDGARKYLYGIMMLTKCR